MIREQLNKINTRDQYISGFGVVEALIGVSILVTASIFVYFSMSLFLNTRAELLLKTQSLYLAEEGLEVLRYLRDEDWSVLGTELSTDTTYYLLAGSDEVGTTTVPEVIDGTFTRSFVLRDVYRDDVTTDVSAGGAGTSIDSDAKEVEMSVFYGTGTTTLTTILTNLFGI